MSSRIPVDNPGYPFKAAFFVVFCLSFLVLTAVGVTSFAARLLTALVLTVAILMTYNYYSLRRTVWHTTLGLREFLRGTIQELPDEPGPQSETQELSDALRELADRMGSLEEDLDRQKKESLSIINSLIDGLIVVDPDLTVRLLNKAATKLLNFRDANPEGKYLWEVARNYNLVQSFNDAIEGEHPVEVEVRLFSPKRTLRVHTNPIRNNGKIVGAVAVLHDITEIRRLEQVRTDFVANVSHELRTPITSIKGFVETLLDGALENPEDARHFLTIIQRETERMVNIVNDLLELSRIESAQAELPANPIDIRAVISRTVHSLREKAESKQIELSVDLPNTELVISGDEGMIGQVVFNLADNAIKYSRPGDSVKVCANQIGDMVHLIVKDTGVGISQRHLDRIFERFYRVDKGRSRELGGTGLGLSIVKHIVDKHSGTISVESKVGEGSRFTVSFPAFTYNKKEPEAVHPKKEK